MGGTLVLPCPNCGADLRFIEDFGREYCDACGQYAPEGYGEGKGLTCPKCGGILSYIKDYNRYFCHKDQEYAPEETGREPGPPPEEPEPQLSSIDDLLPPEPEPEPGPQPEPQPEEPSPPPPPAAPPEPTVETPIAEPSPPPAEAAPLPMGAPSAEPADVEMPPAVEEKPRREGARPPLDRDEILKGKKAALMDLAAAYGLETMGTKEALRERLFAELVRIEKEEERREREERQRKEEAEQAAAQAATPEPASPATEVQAADVEVSAPAIPVQEPEPSLPSEPAASPVDSPPIVTPAPAEVAFPTTEETTPTPEVTEERTMAEAPPTHEAPSPAPAIVPEAPRVINPCPTCGRELSYIDAYDRYYCHHCRAYAPPVVKVETVPAPPRIGRPCPTCGRELTFIPEYNRHYCYNCKKYAALEGQAAPSPQPAPSVEVIPPKPEPTPAPAPPPAVEIVAVKNPCPTCGRELSYIEKYGRFYCYSCKKYAPPRPKNPCPNCGKELTFIAQYQRHYCPACGQYAPRELTVQILAARSAAVAAAIGATARPVAAVRTVAVAVHHHGGSPSGAVGLAGVGLLVLLMYEFLWALPQAFNPSVYKPGMSYLSLDQTTSGALGFIVQLVGLLMIGLGIIVGLVRLRTLK